MHQLTLQSIKNNEYVFLEHIIMDQDDKKIYQSIDSKLTKSFSGSKIKI